MGEYVLITGSTSDIGVSIATVLSKQYNLILNGRSEQKLGELKSKLVNAENHVLWTYDLANLDMLLMSVSSLMNDNKLNIGHFIHVAGIAELIPLRKAGYKSLQNHFNVNLFSAGEILLALLKKENKKFLKNIIFISSTYANFGGKAQTGYSASKAAIDAYVRGAAVELAPDIRVNSIIPGGIKNNKISHYDEDYLNKLTQAHPMGLGEPVDIANAVEFLISEKAKWITGQSLIVDGGYSVNSIR